MHKIIRCTPIPLIGIVIALGLSVSGHAISAETTLINRTPSGAISNGTSYGASMSANGRYIAFSSDSTDLLGTGGTDANGSASDVYVADTVLGVIERVSVGPNGEQGNRTSRGSSISADGRYVAFTSFASNFVPGDSRPYSDIYVHDRFNRTTTLVSRNDEGVRPNRDSRVPVISADGRYVAYESRGSNIVTGDTNDNDDIFVFDRLTLSTTSVSVSSVGIQGNSASRAPTISGDGRYVAFESFASNLDPGDTNGVIDVFRHDIQTGETTAVSKIVAFITIPLSPPVPFNVFGNSFSSQPSISANGQFVAFTSNSSNLSNSDTDDFSDVLLKDMNNQSASLTLLSRDSNGEKGNARSFGPTMSSDARYITFISSASNLVDEDINDFKLDDFLFDRTTGHTERLNVSSDRPQGVSGGVDGGSGRAAISDDGRYIAFGSGYLNLVPDTIDDSYQLYHRDRGADCDVTDVANQFILPNNQWRLLTLPCRPPENRSTLLSLFADDVAGLLGTSWAVFTYDSTLTPPDYVAATSSTILHPGQGFWILQITGNTVTLDLPEGSRETTGRKAAACTSSNGCFELGLSGAVNDNFLWNLIGNPFPSSHPVQFDELRVTTRAGSCAASVGCTMAEAAAPAANIVFDQFFAYDGSEYSTRESGSILGAWEGYWVPELSLSEFNSPIIQMPR